MTMKNIKYAGDELTLYALCKQLHTSMYTMTGIWTTIKDGVLLSVLVDLGSFYYVLVTLIYF